MIHVWKKITALIIAIIIVCEMHAFIVAADASSFSYDNSCADYGAFDAVAEMHERIEQNKNNSAILMDVESELETMKIYTENKTNPTQGVRIENEQLPDVSRPMIFDQIEKYKPVDMFTTVMDFLTSRPLNYYVYIPYLNSTEDWNKGSLRPDPLSTLLQGKYTTDWVYIDVDNADNDADDETGSDVRARLLPQLEDISQQQMRLYANCSLYVEVENINWNRSLTFYIIKGLGYETATYKRSGIIVLMLDFPVVPSSFTLKLEVDNVEIQNLQTIVKASGPYIVMWYCSDLLTNFALGMYYGEYKVGTTAQTSLFWLKANISGENYAPINGKIRLDMDDEKDVPLKSLHYRASSKSTMHIVAGDVSDNVTYATIEASRLPTSFVLTMDQKETEAGNITIIDFDCADIINTLKYNGTTYFCDSINKIKDAEHKSVYLQILPLPRHLHVETPLKIEKMPPPKRLNVNLTTPFVATLTNFILDRISARFRWAGLVLSGIPDKVLSMLGRGGTAKLRASSPLNIIFALTSKTIVSLATNDTYFSFYNESDVGENEVKMSVCGNIHDLLYLNASVGVETYIEVEFSAENSLRGLFIDENNGIYTSVTVRNIPKSAEITLHGNLMTYNVKAGARTQDFIYISQTKDAYMKLSIVGFPSQLKMFRDNRTMSLSTKKGTTINELSFVISNTDIYTADVPHILIYGRNNSVCISGKLKSIANISWNAEEKILNIKSGKKYKMNLYIDVDGNEKVYSNMCIDPLPDDITVNLLGVSVLEGLKTLPPTNISGVLTFPNIVKSVAQISTNISHDIVSSLLDLFSSFGTFSTNTSFTYTTSTNPTVVGETLIGRDFKLENAYWTHGFCLLQSPTSLVAKVYVSGMPKHGNVRLESTNRSNINILFWDFSPKYPWLLFDVKGILKRDMQLYLEGLEKRSVLSINATIGEKLLPWNISAALDLNFKDIYGNKRTLKNLYVRAKEYSRNIREMELFIPYMPSEVHLTTTIHGRAHMNYSSSDPIPYVYGRISTRTPCEYAAMSKKTAANTKPKVLYILLKDVPQSMSIDVLTGYYDLLLPPTALLPAINMSQSSPGLDMYMSGDGEVFGQRGKFNIQIVDVGMKFSTKSNNYVYKIRGHVGYFRIVAKDIPYSKQYQIPHMELAGTNLTALDVRVYMLFNALPIIDITNINCGNVFFSLATRVTIVGRIVEPKISFFDFALKRGKNAEFPTMPYVHVGKGTISMAGTTRHILVPAIATTILVTLIR